MKRPAAVLLVLSALFCLAAPPASAGVDVNVNIGIPFPGFHVEAAPEMVMVPGAPVYFAPRVSVDLFFFDGFWFTRDHDHWYRGHDYRGPWKEVNARYVPPPVHRVRSDYRARYAREKHIPYGQLKKHWREHRVREDYRRDRDYNGHGGGGSDHGGHDRDWKEGKHEKKEWKEGKKEGKKGGKKGRDDRDD